MNIIGYRDFVSTILMESKASDAFERKVATAINDMHIEGLTAERPTVNTTYSDVRCTYKDKSCWIEVKMNKTDNLGNIRLNFIGGKFMPIHFEFDDSNKFVSNKIEKPLGDFACDRINKNSEAISWIDGLVDYYNKVIYPTTDRTLKANRKNIVLYSANPRAGSPKSVYKKSWGKTIIITPEIMKGYILSKGSTKYICKTEEADLGKVVRMHYSIGKTEPAHFLQCGKEDFYRLNERESNPLGIPNFPNIPLLDGEGIFNFRIAFRGGIANPRGYEVMLEIKFKSAASSVYSLFPESGKRNPFAQ